MLCISFKVNVKALLCICLVLKSRVTIATMGDAVERHMIVQCPEQPGRMNSLYEGMSHLTSNSPFIKKRKASFDSLNVIDLLRNRVENSYIKRKSYQLATEQPDKTNFKSQLRPLTNSNHNLRKISVTERFTNNYKERLQDGMPAPTVESSFVIQPRETNNTAMNITETGTDNVHRRHVMGPVESDADTDVRTFFVRRIRPGRHFSRRPETFSRDVALPWSCQAQSYRVDLGPHALPRYVHDVRCLGDMCWYGHYYCKPIRTQMPVLVLHFGACADNRLPEDVRSRYMLSYVSVNTGCVCGRED